MKIRVHTTVGRLRAMIATLPDDTPVLQEASDHSHRDVTLEAGTALYDPETHTWSQDFGEEDTPEDECGKRVQALLIT